MPNPMTSFYIVLKDDYTPQEIQAAKFVFENCAQFYVLDERSDFECARVPMERAALALKERLLGISQQEYIPEKIEVQKEKK